jgi:hypothetical protein
VFSDIGGWFNEKFTGAYSKITGAFSKTKSWASDRWSDISGAFSDVGGWFSEKFTGAYTNIKSAFSDPKGWAQTQWDNISGIFNDVGGWFSDKFTGAYTNIQSAFADPKGWAQTQWSNIKSGFANIKGWFSEKFGGAWDKIKEVFAFDTVKSHFISVKNSAVNGLVGVAGRIKQKFSDAWTKVKEAFSISTVKQHFKDIKDDIVEVFDGLSGALKTPFNAVIDLLNKGIRELNKFSIDVPDAISDVIGIDSFGFNIPEIPKLAQGTVIPPNKEFLAVLGDQKSGTNIEAPLSTIEQAVANVLSRWNGGNSGDMTIDMTVNLDGQKVYKDIIKLNKAQIRKTGNNPLAT